MYFSNFPQTFFTLDNRTTVQYITNILIRSVFTDELKNNFTLFDEYDIIDGETPEITAFKIYGNSELHWLILHLNDIIDPRFDWVLSQNQLKSYVEEKYGNTNAIHHYVDSNNDIISGNVSIVGSSFTNYSVGDVVYNQGDFGEGYVITKPSSTNIIVIASKGGFRSTNVITNNLTSFSNVTISSVTTLSGTPVTNLRHEEEVNESKRRIKILKPQYVQRVINDFQSKMSEINV